MIDYTVGPFLVRSDSGMFLREKDVSLVESEKYIVWDPQRSIPQRYDVPEVAPALAGIYKVKGVDCKPAFQLLADLVQQYPPAVASEITGISADTITRLAIEYATKKPVASFRGMGGTRGNLYGDLNFRAISTLAALTGNISFEGRASFGTNFFALMSRGIPSFMPVLQMHEAILTGKPYPIKALWRVRINLINADPDFNKMVKEIVPRLELIVVADMFMSTSAQYADIVLPACSFYECTDLLSPIGFGSHNYLQLQQKVIEPLHESRSDFEILASLAKTMGMDGYLDKSAEECIELLLTSDHPSMEGITLEKLKESPMPPAPHSLPAFSTPSGRLEVLLGEATGIRPGAARLPGACGEPPQATGSKVPTDFSHSSS
jgi:molybdopterin-containing oxidoreductase family molybdopterin binding subunit